MFEQVQRQDAQPVVVVASRGAADLLVATLHANGIEASTVMASVYPSLDWVEGIAVTVTQPDADFARALLRDLGHEPIETA